MRRILLAIREGDVAGAETAAKDHIRKARTHARAAMQAFPHA
jgi:DNA-binding GntR family transcriptional regulator